MTEGLIALGLMMVLALLRIPIAIAMGVVGFLGVAYLRVVGHITDHDQVGTGALE